MHSRNSPDAYFLGNTQLSAEDAYRFAQGEPVHVNGSEYRLRRPLDFLVVTDHAEYMGVLPGIDELDPALMATELGRRWRRYVDSGDREPIFDEFVASLHTAEHRYPTSPAFQHVHYGRLCRARHDCGACGVAQPVGARDRSDADQGRQRSASPGTQERAYGTPIWIRPQ